MKHMKSSILIMLMLFVTPLNKTIAASNADLENGINFFSAEKYYEAKKVFSDITNEQSDNPEAWYYLGRLCFIYDEFDDAIKYLKKAIKLNRKSSEYHYWLAMAYRERIKNVSKIGMIPTIIKYKSAIEKAVELDPNNKQARFELGMYLYGAPAFGGGSKEKAMEHAVEIKKRDPQMGHLFYAEIYMAEKKYKSAEKEYIALIEADPKNFQYQLYYTQYQIEIKEYEKAYKKLVKLIEDYPEESLTYYYIGKIGFESGDYLEEAEKNMLVFIKMISSLVTESATEKRLKSQTHALHYMLGTIYMKNVKLDLAKKEYETALQINPDYKEAMEALSTL